MKASITTEQIALTKNSFSDTPCLFSKTVVDSVLMAVACSAKTSQLNIFHQSNLTLLKQINLGQYESFNNFTLNGYIQNNFLAMVESG